MLAHQCSMVEQREYIRSFEVITKVEILTRGQDTLSCPPLLLVVAV